MQPSILQFLRSARSKNKLNSPHGTTWASPLNFTLGNWQKVSDRMSPWNPLKGCNILRKDKTTHLRMSCRACGEENSWFEEQSVSKVLFLHNTMCKKCSSPIALPLCHFFAFLYSTSYFCYLVARDCTQGQTQVQSNFRPCWGRILRRYIIAPKAVRSTFCLDFIIHPAALRIQIRTFLHFYLANNYGCELRMALKPGYLYCSI